MSKPYDKVGCLTWKDLQTIQKEMLEPHVCLMASILEKDAASKVAWLNDEVRTDWKARI